MSARWAHAPFGGPPLASTLGRRLKSKSARAGVAHAVTYATVPAVNTMALRVIAAVAPAAPTRPTALLDPCDDAVSPPFVARATSTVREAGRDGCVRRARAVRTAAR